MRSSGKAVVRPVKAAAAKAAQAVSCILMVFGLKEWMERSLDNEDKGLFYTFGARLEPC